MIRPTLFYQMMCVINRTTKKFDEKSWRTEMVLLHRGAAGKADPVSEIGDGCIDF